MAEDLNLNEMTPEARRAALIKMEAGIGMDRILDESQKMKKRDKNTEEPDANNVSEEAK